MSVPSAVCDTDWPSIIMCSMKNRAMMAILSKLFSICVYIYIYMHIYVLWFITGKDLDKDSIFIYSYFVPRTVLLFYMRYFIYFLQQSEYASGGGNRYSSLVSDCTALRFKFKRES